MLFSEKVKQRNRNDKAREGLEGPRSLKVIPSHRRMAMYESSGWDENKHAQRAWVASEAKRFFGYKEYVKVLSLPGESWAFERMLQRLFPRQEFVGIESDPATYERGLANMPGIGDIRRECCQVANREVEVARLNGHVNFVHGHLDQAFLGNVKGYHSFWHEMLHGFDVVFLDTNSPLGSDRTLEYARASVRRLKRKGVFAMSFVLGRDTKELASLIRLMPGESPADKRQSLLRHVISLEENVTVLSASQFTHTSATVGSSLQMCTVAMFIKKTRKKSAAQ